MVYLPGGLARADNTCFQSKLNELFKQNNELLVLNRDLERQVKELTFLHNTLTGLIKTYDMAGTVAAILDMAVEITESEAGCILLTTGQSSRLEITLARGQLDTFSGEYLAESQFIKNIMYNPGISTINYDDPRMLPLRQQDPLFRSLIAVPLQIEKKVIGVLVLMHRHHGEDNHRIIYTDSDCHTVLKFSKQAALILDSTRLKIECGRRDMYLKTITALTSAIDAKDTYTRNHSRNVARFATALGEAIGITQDEIMTIHYGAILHDIGKIGIPEVILNKPGPLNKEEFSLIKTHPTMGSNILAPIDLPEATTNIVYHHHERWDGNGYPMGLKGEGIPMEARIVTIADAWDAMTSHRAYRKALTIEKALGEINSGSGTQFDPSLVKVFNKLIKKQPELLQN